MTNDTDAYARHRKKLVEDWLSGKLRTGDIQVLIQAYVSKYKDTETLTPEDIQRDLDADKVGELLSGQDVYLEWHRLRVRSLVQDVVCSLLVEMLPEDRAPTLMQVKNAISTRVADVQAFIKQKQPLPYLPPSDDPAGEAKLFLAQLHSLTFEEMRGIWFINHATDTDPQTLLVS